MPFITHSIVEHDDGRSTRKFFVSLYDDRAYISNKRAQLKRGSALFRAVLKTMHEHADPGSLTRERMAQCADTADL